MKNTLRAAVALSILTSVIGLSSAAEAQPTKKDDSYGYVFTDDILNAGQAGPTTAHIRVVKQGRRDRLLRPRVHFVSEMLKSVENM